MSGSEDPGRQVRSEPGRVVTSSHTKRELRDVGSGSRDGPRPLPTSTLLGHSKTRGSTRRGPVPRGWGKGRRSGEDIILAECRSTGTSVVVRR